MTELYKANAGAHPITPPPELVEQWRTKPEFAEPGLTSVVSMTQSRLRDIAAQAAQAAQWGADQELEACCKWFADDVVSEVVSVVAELRAARRPEPPSLKEQALAVLDDCTNCLDGAHENTLRRALEQLPDAL